MRILPMERHGETARRHSSLSIRCRRFCPLGRNWYFLPINFLSSYFPSSKTTLCLLPAALTIVASSQSRQDWGWRLRSAVEVEYVLSFPAIQYYFSLQWMLPDIIYFPNSEIFLKPIAPFLYCPHLEDIWKVLAPSYLTAAGSLHPWAVRVP